MKDRFQSIAEEWFLTEPLLFEAYCRHRLVPAPPSERIADVALRSGKGIIEYNPGLIAEMDENSLRECLKLEMIRILLKHPYQRQPQPAKKEACYWASDLVLQDHYAPKIRLSRREDFPDIPFPGYAAAFEEYYRFLLPACQERQRMGNEGKSPGGANPDAAGRQLDAMEKDVSGNASGEGNPSREPGTEAGEPSSGGNGKACPAASNAPRPAASGKQDPAPEQETVSGPLQEKVRHAAGLWEEDPLMQEEINRIIEIAEQSRNWGSLKGQMREKILASMQARVDCAKILNGFRASVLSSKRILTRMRPSRRYGFEYLGNRRKFSTRLLVAVDVSGSVPSESIGKFFALVNRFFKYGMDAIDVLQFDTCLKGEPASLKRAMKEVTVSGRGGSDYQAVFDFLSEEEYDGLILCTDGFAPIPSIPKDIKTRILWVFNHPSFYEKHVWARNLPNSRAAFLE